MTEGYDCYQNALAERINGTQKGEFLLHRSAKPVRLGCQPMAGRVTARSIRTRAHMKTRATDP
ncbi:hypothetical protein J2732_000108 [Achromobacter deleyi]|nr:hypothetical protein [Achromobacter deleyi]